MIITSRRVSGILEPSEQQLLMAVLPARNMITWVTGIFTFRDNQPATVIRGQNTLEEVLENLLLPSFKVRPSPSYYNLLGYAIDIKPFVQGPFITFKAEFRVQP